MHLGPGLLGGIYDGLLRPLADADEFLVASASDQAIRYSPSLPAGIARTGATVATGDLIGRSQRLRREASSISSPFLSASSGTLDHIAEPGSWRMSSEVVATIDGNEIGLTSQWPIRIPRPYQQRNPQREPFRTGQRVLDVLVPIAKGNSATVIGGFGEGKTMLLEQLAKWGDADVIIYVGCGERGNELTDLISELGELTDPRSGRRLMERTIILANTSNMPVMAREASIYTAVTVAEYYRDMGHHAVIIADSTSRWAEAQRELASRTGAIPAEEGYPADLPASLAAFYQRAGHGSPPSEAATGRSPSSPPCPRLEATSPNRSPPIPSASCKRSGPSTATSPTHATIPPSTGRTSFSRDRDMPSPGGTAAHDDPDWGARNARLHALLAEADRLQGIADLVGLTALPTEERLILLTGRHIREAVLQQSALSDNDAFCSPAKQAALADAVLAPP